MSRSPHPAFARLYALGGAPGRAAERLAAPCAAGSPLDHLAADLEGLDLLSDRAIAPLVRELDFAGVAGVVERVFGPTQPDATAAASEPRAEAPGTSPARPGKRLAPGRESIEAALAPYAPAAADRQPAGSSRFAAPRPPARNAAALPNAQEGMERLKALDRRPVPPPDTPRSRAGGRVPPPWAGGGWWQGGGQEGGVSATTDSPAVLSGLFAEAGEGEGRAVSEKVVRGGSAPLLASPLTPPAPSQGGGTRPGTRPPLRGLAIRDSLTEGDRGEAPEAPTVGALLARALGRLEDRRGGRSRAGSLPPIRQAAGSTGFTVSETPAPSGPPSPPSAEVPASGLRRLAALAAITPPAASGGTLDTETAAAGWPSVVRERLEEAALGARLERLLRREALGAGIDLSEVDR